MRGCEAGRILGVMTEGSVFNVTFLCKMSIEAAKPPRGQNRQFLPESSHTGKAHKPTPPHGGWGDDLAQSLARPVTPITTSSPPKRIGPYTSNLDVFISKGPRWI